KEHPNISRLKEFSHGIPVAIHLVDSHTSGNSIEELRKALVDEAKKLPVYGMDVPRIWQQVRENLSADIQNNLLSRTATLAVFNQYLETKDIQLTAEDIDNMLFYLEAAGDLYKVSANQRMPETIIFDMLWALEAIYKPLDRDNFGPDARAFRAKVGCRTLFSAFGQGYSEEEKRLFLRFMYECGICFPADAEWDGVEKPELLIFPSYLPDLPERNIQAIWSGNEGRVHVRRAKLAYRDITSFHALLTDIGRMGQEPGMWYYGIDLWLSSKEVVGADSMEVEIPDGHVLIELDTDKDLRSSAELVVRMDGQNGLAWWPSIQSWIGERFEELNWEEIQAPDGSNNSIDYLPRPIPKSDVRPSIGRLEILWVEACPLDLSQPLSFAEEKEQVEARIGDRGGTVWSRTIKEANKNKLQDCWELDEDYPQIVHFLGHGSEEGLYFHGRDGRREIISGSMLKDILRPLALEYGSLQIVLLNGCHTADVARAVSRLGVYVIGTNNSLRQDQAKVFSGQFYAGIVTRPHNPLWAFQKAIKNMGEIKGLFEIYHNGQILEDHGS
ncbi:MAG: COR domain-containing protein, partial [Bacteroidota bacterium]